MGLLDLIHDLYAFSAENQTFLHTRFNQTGDPLKPYKKILEWSLSPNVIRNQNVSVTTAKRAISAYKKAIGDPVGLAELLVFFANARSVSAWMLGKTVTAIFEVSCACFQ